MLQSTQLLHDFISYTPPIYVTEHNLFIKKIAIHAEFNEFRIVTWAIFFFTDKNNEFLS